jgi:hypothetical protein
MKLKNISKLIHSTVNTNPYIDNKVIKGMIEDHKELEHRCKFCKVENKEEVCKDCNRINPNSQNS